MFITSPFVSHSGLSLDWKIDCDSLTDADWACIAKIIAAEYTFKRVVGVPRGGLKFAAALDPYKDPAATMTLVVDDVLTTGKSMKEMAAQLNLPNLIHSQPNLIYGVVLFSRTEQQIPGWIVPVFSLHHSLVK